MSPSFAGNSGDNNANHDNREGTLLSRASLSLMLEDSSQVGEARRAAATLAAALNFSPAAQSNLAIVVTEAANNILHHAGKGEILLRAVTQNAVAGVELLALDKGPGMGNVAQCMEDGFSTAGTPGTGLGAISRLSDMEVYSRPGQGTALLSYSWASNAPRSRAPGAVVMGVVNRPKPGQELCGDNWAAVQTGDGNGAGRFVVLVADGLGHGPDAAAASRAAVAEFGNCGFGLAPAAILERLHIALRGTRGAAVAVADINSDSQNLSFAGIGNITGDIRQPDSTTSLVSHYGIVGYQVRKIQEFSYPCPAGSLVIFASDGIATLGSLAAYTGLQNHAAALVAGVLYRDFQRVSDDSTIVVLKIPPFSTDKAILS